MRTLLEVADIYVEGKNIRVTINGEAKIGNYSLETVQGTTIATVNTKSGMFWFRVDPQKLSTETAGSCMRIRTPDNDFLAIGFRKSEEFKIPALEMEVIKNYEIPRIKRLIALYDSQCEIRENEKNWLETHPDLYVDNYCQFPDTGPEPEGVCSSKFKAEEMYGDYCFSANVVCNVGGTFAAQTLFGENTSNLNQYADIAEFFAANGCSLAVDKFNGVKINGFTALRSMTISFITDGLYKTLINKNPSIEEKYFVAAVAGSLNYELCINDMYSECITKRNQWLYPYRQLYSQCNEHKNRYDEAVRIINQLEENHEDLEKLLSELNAQIKKGNKKSIQYYRSVSICSNS